MHTRHLVRILASSLVTLMLVMYSGQVWAQGAGYAITPAGNFGNTNPGYPTSEGPTNVVDNNTSTKYLNFGAPEYVTGVVITPAAGSTTVTGLRLSTANDFPGRDPLTYVLEGSTGGPNGTFVPISIGLTGLTTDPGRFTAGPAVTFINTLPYTNYRLTFPTVRATIPTGEDNSLQISEIELLNAAGADVTAPGDAVLAIHQIPEPSALSVIAIGGVALLRRRK